MVTVQVTVQVRVGHAASTKPLENQCAGVAERQTQGT